MLEGIAARAASITDKADPKGQFSALKYLEKICDNLFIADELTEIFVVRDAIVHAHLCETNVSTDPDSWMKIIKRDLSSLISLFEN